MLKKGTWTVYRFKRGELGKNEEVVFLWRVDTPMHTMTIWKVLLNKTEQNALFNIEEIM